MKERKIKSILLASSVLLCLPISQIQAEIRCSEDTVCIETKIEGNKILFYASNKKTPKVSVKVDVSHSGMRASSDLPAKFILEGEEERFIFSLEYGKKAWRYNYQYDWSRGDYTADHNKNYIYALPYAKGIEFEVGQSCNGDFSHFDTAQYAIDFELPVNTPVHAARGGKVVGIKHNSSSGGPSKSYVNDGNHVIIEHPDRTLGEYVHLKLDGTTVSLGQDVKKGELIGYSGNTGYSSGPHLHFIVRSTNEAGKGVSFPVSFATNNGVVNCPPKGLFLRH